MRRRPSSPSPLFLAAWVPPGKADELRKIAVDAIRRGLAQKNNTSETNRMLRALNQLAGAISLDILDNEALRDRIERVMPPKAEGVRTPRS